MMHNDREARILIVQARGDAVALFLSLYLGHILGDFVFQPGRLVLAKRRRQSAVLMHTGIVTVCTALVLSESLRALWAAVLLTGIAHFCVEQLTIRARRLPDSSNLMVFFLDQGLHIVAIVLIAVASGAAVTPALGPWPVSLRALAVVAGVATVAFGGSIVVFEVQVAREAVEPGPDRILGLDGGRVYGMTERAAALLAALLLPVPALGLLAFAPRALAATFGPKDRRHQQATAVVTGLALCTFTWVLVSLVG